MNKKRIVSLLPSATEIVCGLGLSDYLVGISHECDFPEEIKNLPICTSTLINSNESSLQIHHSVNEINQNNQPLYSLNEELIVSLQPDIIITQSQCDFCAVSLQSVKNLTKNKLEPNTQIITLNTKLIDDLFEDIATIAKALNVQCDAYVEELKDRIHLIQHKIKFISKTSKIFCVEWLQPLMESGNWLPDMLRITNAAGIKTKMARPSEIIYWDDVLKANPDKIIFMSCGYTIEKILKEINDVVILPKWHELSAVKNNEVFIVDGNAYFNRSGPRLIDSLEILAEIIYPKQFNFGYENAAWIKFGT